MGYYDGDPWSNHELNELKCAECGDYFDQQEKEGGNICPVCIEKEGEIMCGDHLVPIKECRCI